MPLTLAFRRDLLSLLGSIAEAMLSGVDLNVPSLMRLLVERLSFAIQGALFDHDVLHSSCVLRDALAVWKTRNSDKILAEAGI